MAREERYRRIGCREDVSAGAVRQVADELADCWRIVAALAEECERGRRDPSLDEVWLVNRVSSQVNWTRWGLFSEKSPSYLPKTPSSLIQKWKAIARIKGNPA
jgi:hypothetical protein